ncbi:MAG TPA: hypothetical protein VKA86_13025 [Candidatus Krumholzibacteria bacterium]|nr:hypothetical protein [Candidatus Krumholzibacteria bacterium]
MRIIHCCGFDSIPSDLGTRALQDAVIARDGRLCDEVKLFVVDLRGAVSGGTIESMVGVMDAARDPAVRKVLGDPYALNPPGERHGPDRREPRGPDHDRVTDTWTAPVVAVRMTMTSRGVVGTVGRSSAPSGSLRRSLRRTSPIPTAGS